MPPAAPLRVLCAAFAVVPGSSAHAPAMYGLAAALHANMDFVTLKAEALPHLERFGQAQMLRVPVGGGTENAQRSAFSRAIRRQMESESYDVVHVRGPVEGLVALELRASQGFKVIYEMGSYPDESDGLSAEKGWAAAHVMCLEGADLVIVPSEAATRASAVRSRMSKLHVVPPGVDVDAYDWRAHSRDELGAQTPRLLYLGSFGADRDLGTLLGSVREVARRTPLRVLLAGEPDPARRQRVRRLVGAFELNDVVEVRGEPAPLLVPQIIAAADVCLAPAAASPRFQEHGDVPQPLLEYFAGRRAVLAAGVPAVGEVLLDERDGLLYPPGDEDALTESLMTLLDDRALRERLAREGYERARGHLSAGARRRRLVEVYEALVPGSQLRDAWTSGFDNEGTGQWELPPLGSEATGAGRIRESASPRDAEPPLVGPQETEVLMTMGSPMNSSMPPSLTPPPLDVEELARFDARFDTNPGGAGSDGSDTGETSETGDIAGAPTVIKHRFDTMPGMPLIDDPSERVETGEREPAGEVQLTTSPGESLGRISQDTAQHELLRGTESDTGDVGLPAGDAEERDAAETIAPPSMASSRPEMPQGSPLHTAPPPARQSAPPPPHIAPPPARQSAPPPPTHTAPPPARQSAPPPTHTAPQPARQSAPPPPHTTTELHTAPQPAPRVVPAPAPPLPAASKSVAPPPPARPRSLPPPPPLVLRRPDAPPPRAVPPPTPLTTKKPNDEP